MKMTMTGTGKPHAFTTAAAATTATPAPAPAGGPAQGNVTNATHHNKIKLLRADNEHLTKDMRAMKGDMKTLLRIVGGGTGVGGGAAPTSGTRRG